MSFKQMRNRRLIHGISKKAIADKMGCSYAWVDTLDRGLYDGPSSERWRDRYEQALNELIESKKGR